MRLVELKCKNCGANLEIDEGEEIVNCPYCNATYKIDDEAQHIKYDDMENSGYEFEKGRIKAQKESFENITKNVNIKSLSKIPIIMFIIVVVLMVAIFLTSVLRMKNVFNENNQNNDYANQNNDYANSISEAEKRSFNGVFELYSGTASDLFVCSILDEVSTNNKKNSDRIITVVYNETVTSNPSEIIELKKQFVYGEKYEVILDYDENGLVNKVTIE